MKSQGFTQQMSEDFCIILTSRFQINLGIGEREGVLINLKCINITFCSRIFPSAWAVPRSKFQRFRSKFF